MIPGDLFNTPLKNWSNLFAQIKINNIKAIYYPGFG